MPQLSTKFNSETKIVKSFSFLFSSPCPLLFPFFKINLIYCVFLCFFKKFLCSNFFFLIYLIDKSDQNFFWAITISIKLF